MNNWISLRLEKYLPKVNKRVEFALFHSEEGKIWQSTGWLKKDGTFSIKQTKDKSINFFNSTPTHWREIDIEPFGDEWRKELRKFSKDMLEATFGISKEQKTKEQMIDEVKTKLMNQGNE